MTSNKERPARVKVRQVKPKVIKIVPVSGTVGDIKVNSATNQVYFVQNENEVGVLDGKTNQLISNVKVGEGATFLTVNSRTNRIYSTNFRDATVSVIDGKTHRVITTIPVGEHPFGIGIHLASNRIYVANTSGSISIISGISNRVLRTLQVGGSPSVLGINERTNRIYVTNTEHDVVHVIDGKTQKMISVIKVGRNPIIAPSVNMRTNRIYVANNLSRYLSVINGRTNQKSVPAYLGRLQSGLALNPVTNRIYVTSAQVEGRGKLFVMNGLSNKVLRTLQIPTFTEITLNPQTNHFFVSDSEKKELIVYSGYTNSRIATLRTGDSPGNMALNFRTNRLYVGNSGAITVIQDRKAEKTHYLHIR
ncbi:YncE family protein [Paenibacillus sp. GCM10027628]|uniref:YncE family protein n=1 Tax=Paenibacillus sp. GCM10027628 TaxID=3273413 RepID=UPI0036269ACE